MFKILNYFLPVVILVSAIFLHFSLLGTLTAWPEMFSYPYLINKGFLIYKDFVHPYEPLLSFFLSVIYNVFGYDLKVYQWVIWSILIINHILLFLTTWKLAGKNIAALSVFFYALLQPVLDGNMLWFDLAVSPLIIASLFVFSFIRNNSLKYLSLGLTLSLAVFVKQQAGLILFFLFIYLLVSKNFKLLKFFLLGSIIPATIIFGVIVYLGVFEDFIFWTLQFPFIWLPQFPGYSQMPSIRQAVNTLVIFSPAVIFVLFYFRSLKTFEKIILLILTANILMAFPRFSYFHLQPALVTYLLLLPAVVKKNFKAGLIVMLFLSLGGVLLWKDERPFVDIESARFYEKEDIEFANTIKSESMGFESIYLFGPHSLAYVLSDTIPPKPWVENFVWYFEIPGMQEKFIKGLDSSKTIIFKSPPLEGNWFDLRVYQPAKVIDYINSNYRQTYKLKGNIEVWIK